MARNIQEGVYGSWKSPITSDLIVQSSVGLRDIRLDPFDEDTVYWSELRPDEGGRIVVCSLTKGQSKFTSFTPKAFNCRTRVHEYGGASFFVHRKQIYFSNFADQKMYRQKAEANSVPQPITPENRKWRYADGEMTESGFIVCVREDHEAFESGDAVEAQNTIVSINPEMQEQFVLVSGSNFYSAPRVSPSGVLTWVQWNHPNMPWDSTELWSGQLSKNGDSLVKESVKKVSGGEGISIMLPQWSPDGHLLYIHDKTNWWNLYRHDNGTETNLCPMDMEIGGPHWVFGQSPYSCDPKGSGDLLVAYGKKLSILQPSGVLKEINTGFSSHSHVHIAPNGKEAYMLAGSPTKFAALIKLELNTFDVKVLRESSSINIDSGYFSIPTEIPYPTTDGKVSHGNFYLPKNKDYKAPEGSLPPLLVKVHGGPTSQASQTLYLGIQYFTSRGFAVLDVNYRGSSGYGREYRNELLQSWGVVDVDDVCNGALYLANTTKQVDPECLAIDGGSAGGYTTLAVLTFRDVFKAGASHYGIGDIEALVKDTHKFESRYIDMIIGPYPQAIEVYKSRSPIHHVEKLNCPLALFQGDEDKIVPQNQADMMFNALKEKGIPVAYKLFPGEQHGFRKSENIKTALDGEFYFYSRVFGFKAADNDVKVERKLQRPKQSEVKTLHHYVPAQMEIHNADKLPQ